MFFLSIQRFEADPVSLRGLGDDEITMKERHCMLLDGNADPTKKGHRNSCDTPRAETFLHDRVGGSILFPVIDWNSEEIGSSGAQCDDAREVECVIVPLKKEVAVPCQPCIAVPSKVGLRPLPGRIYKST